MPEWQKRTVAAEGEVLLLRGKLKEAEQRVQEAERRATAAERERDVLRVQARKSKPKPGQQQEVGGAEEGGGGAAAGGGGGAERRCEVPHGGEPGLEVPGREGEGGALSSGRHRTRGAWPEGGGAVLRVVVPGYKAALDIHDAVEKRYPADALVEAATNPAFKPPTPAAAQGSGSSIGVASP